jgi:hypothetical protein
MGITSQERSAIAINVQRVLQQLDSIEGFIRHRDSRHSAQNQITQGRRPTVGLVSGKWAEEFRWIQDDGSMALNAAISAPRSKGRHPMDR